MSNTVTYNRPSFHRRVRGGGGKRGGEAGKNSGALNANKGSNFGGDSRSREVASEWRREDGRALVRGKIELEGE